MSKKNNTFGKILAFTTAVAAIGGACYIFRDRIKESSIYKKSADIFSDLFNKISNKSSDEDDDFFFDDDFEDDFSDEVFSDAAKNNREYTSITINPKSDSASENTTESEDSIPTISYEEKDDVSNDTPEDTSAEPKEDTEEVTAYENEGLSDVSEDPDVLEEQDKLDY